MSAALVLILVVVGGYLAAHVAFEWLAHRFLIVSGAEYLILGILLGPQVSGLISGSVFDSFAPLMTLALGWVGVVIGTQFYLPDLIRIRAEHYRIAFYEALASLALVSAVMTLVLAWSFGLWPDQAVLPAIVLGAIATASSPSGIGLIARKLGRRGAMIAQLELTTAIDALVAVTTFGLLLALTHTAPVSVSREPTPTEWAVITLGIGFVGGALFHLFLGGERKIDRLFIALAGAVTFASGASAYLRLSPLLPAMLIGTILVNTSRNRNEIRQVLTSVERPLYFVMLIFAGAAWRPGSEAWLLPVFIFLLVRPLAKLASAWLGGAAEGALPVLGAGWGRALLGQGGLAVAIALNYAVHEGALRPNTVFTAALASVLLTDVSAARLADSVVRSHRDRRASRMAGQLRDGSPAGGEG